MMHAMTRTIRCRAAAVMLCLMFTSGLARSAETSSPSERATPTKPAEKPAETSPKPAATPPASDAPDATPPAGSAESNVPPSPPDDADAGRALLDVLTPPPPPQKPAEANTDADIHRPDPAQAALVARIRKALIAPPAVLDPAFVRHRLDVLVEDCQTLERIAPPGVLKYQALSLQLQALYARIERWPDEPQTDHRLARLRDAARRMKALDKSDAPAIGDFWLTTASLWEINHSELPLDQRRQQVRQLLQDYLDRYSTGAPADAVVKALNSLNAAPPPRTRNGELGTGN